ncbi:MAG: ATP-binding protein [Actinomycetota bacterium]
MTDRTATRLAWSIWTICVATLVVGTVAGLGHQQKDNAGGLAPTITTVMFLLAFATVGALIASRRHTNAVGWLLLACGVSFAVGGFVVTIDPNSQSAAAQWVSGWVWAVGAFLSLSLPFLLFPDGHPPSRRWRPVAWMAVIGVTGFVVGSAFAPGNLADTKLHNPLGLELWGAGHALFTTLKGVAFGMAVLAGFLSVISLFFRYHRAGRLEREQIRWLMFAGVIVIISLVASGPITANMPSTLAVNIQNAITAGALTLVPVAIGIAVLRYRLYDIDVVISKTVVFGALAAFITVLYVGIVVGIGSVLGNTSNPALSIGATALVALLFGPARERVRRFANRLVYGKRATPYEVMSGFARRVAGTLSVDQILPGMAEAAARGVGAHVTRVRVLMPTGEQTVVWPADAQIPAAFERSLEVRYLGEPVGGIDVAKPMNESFTPAEDQLLDDLAGQAGLAMHNVRLTHELKTRAEELDVQTERLRESRERLVTARDQQRRGLERDIREGPARQLVEIRRQLDGAGALAQRDADEARRLLDRLGESANATLDELRDLARGIFPPLLVDKGVVAALRAHIRKIDADAQVHVEPSLAEIRFDADVEACVYFCCVQAIQNVIRHAGNAPSTIELAFVGNTLTFSVRDEGSGFEVGARTGGMGMRIMQDRIDALEGELTIESAPNQGTIVVGRILARALEGV